MCSKRLSVKSDSVFQKISHSLLHGILLMAFAILALNIDYNFAPEESQIKLTLFLNELITKKNDLTSGYTFIDVSASKELVSRNDLTGNQVITDRKVLTRLFNQLKNKTSQPIICDLLFDVNTDHDEDFSKAITKVNGLIIPYSMEGEQQLNSGLKSVKKGYSGYKQSSGLYTSDKLLKYQYLTGKNEATIPLKIVEQTLNITATKGLGLLWLNGKPYFNTTIYENYISPADLNTAEGNSKIIPLNEIVSLLEVDNDTFYNQFFEGKIIVIGDFSNDLHATYSGNIPGSLILVNLIIGFLKGDNELSLIWLSFMLLSFSFLSYFLFYPPSGIKTMLNNLQKKPLISALLEFVTFSAFTGSLSLISFLFFHKHIDVVIISIYLTCIAIIREYRINNKSKP